MKLKLIIEILLFSIKNNILRCFKYWNIDVLHPDFNLCSSVVKPPTPTLPQPPLPPVYNPNPRFGSKPK